MSDAPAPLTLDDHIALTQRESGLVVGRETPALAAFRAAILADPTMAADARLRAGEISAAVLDRDYVSRWLKSTLEGALPEGTT